MNRKNLAAAAAAALALAACTPDFDPASKLDKLRVLAVRAEFPELQVPPASGAPVAPDRTRLTSYVVRADEAADPTHPTTVVYLACVPVPGDPTPSPCVLLASLRDPTVVLADAAQAVCGGGGGDGPPITFLGVETCAAELRTSPTSGTCGPATSGGTTLPAPELVVPSGYTFPEGIPERIIGVEVVVLAFALDATPDELTAGAGGTCPLGDVAARLAELWQGREHVLVTKRVTIRGIDVPAAEAPNANPVIEDVAEGVAPLPPSVPPGTHLLTPILPAGAVAQEYVEYDAEGNVIERKLEDWVYSWFSTAGEMDTLHTRGAEAEEWDASGSAGPALVVTVVRDLRGGVAWTAREVTIAP